ncbi:MAG: hypothetical protein GXP25_05460 [Planctomycetes bacterium]|nr:hypothetical protein [Planctomycetota bacterium]
MEPAQSKIRVERRDASHLEVRVPPEAIRTPRVAVMACAYAALFLGFTVLWVWLALTSRAPLFLRVFSYVAMIPLAVADFVLLVAAANAWLRRIRVEIESDTLTISDFWLFLRWQKKVIPVGDITKIDYGVTGSASRKSNYSVLVHFRQAGVPSWATIASAIAEEREALWLTDELRAALPRAG